MPVLDNSNIQEFMQTGNVAPIESLKEPKVDEPVVDDKTAVDPQVDDDGLTPEERKILGAKLDKIVGKRHKEMMAAKDAAKEAEEFARNQYSRATAAERRAAELEAQMNERKSREAPPVEAKEPDRKDFENDADYWKSLIKWESDQAVQRDRAVRAIADAEKEHRKLDDARIERNKAFAEITPDYVETIESLGEHDLDVPGYISHFLLRSPYSPQIMYHFAKNPDEFKRITALEPTEAMASIGELQADFKRAKAGPAKDEPKADAKVAERPRAPAPITPIAATNGSVHKDLAEMSTRETIEYWQARDQAKASKRQRH